MIFVRKNIPNLLTCARLVLAIAILPCIYSGTPRGCAIAAILFSFALLTDILDGYVARLLGTTSTLGASLDALVDKILIYSVLFSLLSQSALSPIAVFPMFFRDMIVDAFRNRSLATPAYFGANVWGKLKFGFQSLAILVALSGRAWATSIDIRNWADFSLLCALLISLPGLWLSIKSVVPQLFQLPQVRRRKPASADVPIAMPMSRPRKAD
jgi:CDP-diacylglycerol--glycerol-3-phosphate 3-phosphatidyltransferase